MGEFTGIHRKIDALSNTMQRKIGDVGNDVNYMRGKLDATLPLLARTDEVSQMIFTHHKDCRRNSIMPKRSNEEMKTLLKKIAAGLTILAAAIYALVKVLNGEPPELPPM